MEQPALQTNVPQLLLHQLQQPPSPTAQFKIHKAKKNLPKVQEDKEARQLSAKRKGNVRLPAPRVGQAPGHQHTPRHWLSHELFLATQHPLSVWISGSVSGTPGVFSMPLGISHLAASGLLEARRPDDKSNWRAAPVTELCKMKALQILPGRGATPAPSAGWAGRRVTALIGSVFDPCRLRELGEVPPVPWDRGQSHGAPPGSPTAGHTTTDGSERWDAELKHETRTPSARSLSCLPARQQHRSRAVDSRSCCE